VKRAGVRSENTEKWIYHGHMIKAAPGATDVAGLRIAGEGFVHGSTGAKVKKVRRHPDMILWPRPDAVEDSCIYRVGVLVHIFVRNMHCFSDEIKLNAEFSLREKVFTAK
jgi:hypothetical protein